MNEEIFLEFDPAVDDAQALVNALIDPAANLTLIPDSIAFAGATGQASIYDGSLEELGIGAGILLTSGDGSPPLENTESGFTVVQLGNGDPDLQAVADSAFTGAGIVQDANTLEFSFNIDDPTILSVTFDLLFGSDEFPEFSSSAFVDAAGVFVNGQNVALFNNSPTQPLSVINSNLSLGSFIDNQSGGPLPEDFGGESQALPIEYDGVSSLLRIFAPVQQGENVIRFGVADTGDQMLDTGLFLANFTTSTMDVGDGSGVLLVIFGTPEDDILNSSNPVAPLNESFLGLAGNDVITAGAGDDLIDGGTGNDTINPGSGNDNVNAGAGNDTIFGDVQSSDFNQIDGGPGFDTVTFNGPAADFSAIVIDIPNLIIQVGDSTSNDILTNVEQLQFEDVTIAAEDLLPDFFVEEDSTTVGTVSTDLTGMLTFSLIGGPDQSLFNLDANTGVLSFVAPPNFEAPGDADNNNNFDIQVSVTNGTETLIEDLRIAATDVDEGPPVITSAADFVVMENTLQVGSIAAMDPIDTEVALSFSLSGGADQGQFSINAATGVLSFLTAPNFEMPGDANGDNVYEVQVSVTDGTNLVSQDVTVTVTNVSEPPLIASDATFTVAENTTGVGTVEATDPDGGNVTFSLIEGADLDLFSINPTTGSLSFNSAPDFEMPGDADGDNDFEIQVSVNDGTDSVVQDLTVTVANVDEGPPVFTGPEIISVLENTIEISPNPIAVADPDTSTPLTFSLSGGPDQGAFNIDEMTGALSFIEAPDFENPGDANGDNDFEIEISVTDGTVTVSQELTITVADLVSPVTTITTGGSLTFDTTPVGLGNSATATLVDDVLDLGTDAVFDNLVGFYVVANTSGGLDTDGDGVVDLQPDDDGYALAALNSAVPGFSIRAGSSGNPDLNTTAEEFGDVVLAGGLLYAPFVIANGGSLGIGGFIANEASETPGGDGFLDDAEFNDAANTAEDPVVYFAFVGANPDGASHLRSLGNNVFGFEDLPSNLGSSDNDFNDAVFSFNFGG
jgi:hypothetical protein